VLPKLFESESVPSSLPQNLLPELVRRTRVLLCLDYDGTISEIAREPRLAQPVRGAVSALRTLAAHRGRVRVAVISGRTLRDLRSMLSLPPEIALSGVHGLELDDAAGKLEVIHEIKECREDLESARLWLSRNLPANSGFVLEDKGIALALHYRQAAEPIAHYVRDSFERFLTTRTPSLRPRHGKMVLEALPQIATKAAAVHTLWQRAGDEFEPVYFGDDVTDEDAFRELAAQGISVLVGEPRPSAARYRVDGPAEVVRVLKAIAAALEGGARRNTPEPDQSSR
jgi:trehalose 6-phosphate phosphatase